jgi:hypothetical protein
MFLYSLIKDGLYSGGLISGAVVHPPRRLRKNTNRQHLAEIHLKWFMAHP